MRPAQGYTEYSYTVTATGSTSTLEFAAEQNPSQWNLDNVSVDCRSQRRTWHHAEEQRLMAGPATIRTGATLELRSADPGEQPS